MNKLLAFLALSSCLMATPYAHSTPERISPELSLELSRRAVDEFLPVAFILEHQVSFEDIYPLVKDLPKSQRREQVIFRLRNMANETQQSLLADLQALQDQGHASQIRPLWITNGVAARVQSADVTALVARHPEVARVIWDPPRPLSEVLDQKTNGGFPAGADEISWGVQDIHAPAVWALGFLGQGVLIAHLDTGVDYTHPDLAEHIWVNPGEDLNGNGVVDSSDWNGLDDDGNGYADDLRGWTFGIGSPEVMDPDGHGTSTAGIVVGDGTNGSTTGVAPEATLMILNNAYAGESQFWESQQYALVMGADVLTSSISYKWRFHPRPDYATMRQNTRMELAAGLIHSNSIGNEGDNPDTDPIPFNVATPGNCPPPWLHPDQTLIGGITSTLGVGAYGSNYALKAYSSMGPSAWNLDDILSLDPEYPYQSTWPPGFNDYPYVNGQYQALLKPDLAAPTDVLTTALGGGYVPGFSGTSAATPHLGGTLCLLLSAVPSATPDLLAQAVMTTAVDMGEPGKDNFWGCGRLDAFAAVAQILGQFYGTLAGMVTDANTGDPVSSAKVALPDLGMEAATDTLGYYLMPGIPEGIFDVRFAGDGYDTLWVPDVSFSVGIVETLSVALEGPQIWVEPDSIAAVLTQGEVFQQPITVHNTGSSNLSVQFSKQGNWQPYQIYSVIEAQNITEDDELFGVEVANGSIWISGGNSGMEPNKLYCLSFAGELLQTLNQPPSASALGWHDLAWDGQYFYGSSGPTIEGVDSLGVLQTTIQGPLQLHRALAYDPGTDHFYACDDTTNIVEFGRDGAVLNSWGHDLHVQGLAWHPQDDDGCPLYIFSQDGSGAMLRLSKMNPDDGEIVFLSDLVGVPGDAAGGAAVSGEIDPDRWCFVGLIQGAATVFDRIQIYSLNAYAPWLSVEPDSGVIPPGDSLEVLATLDADAVPPGDYNVNLVVLHDAAQDEVVIPVSLTVSPVGVINTPSSNVMPRDFRVFAPYPNPFNAETVISIELPQRSRVRVELFNVAGRNLDTIFEGVKEVGEQRFRYNAAQLSSGIYFYRVTVQGLEGGGSFRQAGKILLLK